MIRSGSPPLGRRLVYALVVLAFFLGSAEVLARLFGQEVLEEASSPPPESVDGTPNLQGNPYLLWEMVPGERYEMGVTARINRLGLRGPDRSPQPPAGVRRIMAVGDSSVFGFGVADEEVFTAVLDEQLGESVQVINSAVPGYSTYQIINLLEIRALALQPDVLIVGALWSDNNFDSFVDREVLSAYHTFGSTWSRRIRRVALHSTLFRILDYRLRVERKLPQARKVGWMVGRGEPIGPRRVALNDYARNLETITQIAHERDCEVMFLILSNEEDLEPSGEGPAAWDPYRRAMRDTARRHGAPVVDVPALFRESGLTNEDLFLDEMHPTATGHRIIAEAVYAVLEERGWIAGEPLETDPEPGPVPTYEDPFVENTAEPLPEPTAGQPGPPAEDAPSLTGEVVAPRYEQGVIQLDFIDADRDPPQVVATARLEGPGTFEVRLLTETRHLRWVAYLDENADGPGPGDTRIEGEGDPLALSDTGPGEPVIIDLSEGRAIRTFADDSESAVAPGPGTDGKTTTPGDEPSPSSQESSP